LITYANIKRFHDGKYFTILHPEKNEIIIENSAELQGAFWHYYNLYDDFRVFGILPHGKGTLDEPDWYKQIIKTFDRLHKELEEFNLQK
jgi:hypothetical protein